MIILHSVWLVAVPGTVPEEKNKRTEGREREQEREREREKERERLKERERD